MREKHHGTQPLCVVSQFGECSTQHLNQVLQGGKDAIVQVFLAHLWEEVFNGIDLWAISRLKDQTNIRLPPADLWPGATQLDRLA